MANDASPSPTSAYSRDSGGKSAPPAADLKPDVATTPVEAPKAEPAKEAAPVETKAPEDTNRHVPLSELLSERAKAKEYKAKLEEADKRTREYEAFVARVVEQQNRAQQQQAQEQQPQFDPTLQPQEWAEQQRRENFHLMRDQIANQSQAWATRTHGQELVQKALEWTKGNPQLAQHLFYRSADPYSEMVDAYKRASALQEIGDPDAWRKAERQRIEAEVLAKLKAGNPPPPQTYPGSLATATSAANGQGAIRTQQDMAARIYGSDRNRRAP